MPKEAPQKCTSKRPGSQKKREENNIFRSDSCVFEFGVDLGREARLSRGCCRSSGGLVQHCSQTRRPRSGRCPGRRRVGGWVPGS
eukprot:3645895-Rhodomonas_salina.2